MQKEEILFKLIQDGEIVTGTDLKQKPSALINSAMAPGYPNTRFKLLFLSLLVKISIKKKMVKNDSIIFEVYSTSQQNSVDVGHLGSSG